METTLVLKITGETMEKLFEEKKDDFYVKFYESKELKGKYNTREYNKDEVYTFSVIFRHSDHLDKRELLREVEKIIY